MTFGVTIYAEFTCDKCSKTISMSHRRENERQTLDTCLSKCVEAVKKKGWRVIHNEPFVQDGAFCAYCDKKIPCAHGYSYGSCIRDEDCTHKREIK